MAALSDKARPFTRFIAAEEIGAVSRWKFERMDPAGDPLGSVVDMQSIDQARKAGYAEGYAAGHSAAMAQAGAEMAAYHANKGQENARRFAALVAAAEIQLDAVQQDIAQGALELAVALARQVVRRELVVRADAVEPVAREALALLMSDSRSARLRLSPEDFEWLEKPLRAEFATQAVNVIADPAVRPGDCMVDSESTVVDGTLATRWARAVASLGLSTPWDDAPAQAAAAPVVQAAPEEEQAAPDAA